MKTVQLENVGKKFILSHQGDGVIGNFIPKFSKQRTIEEFWALRDINMEIDEGIVIGIIGRNGAGKSTLLNIIAGICVPTEGKVEIKGRVSSLLTLGAGFQDELSGKENIYLNASILGMRKEEINKKFRNIVDFSELDGFLDVPIQTYSQGMRMRLGFSIAIHMDFDILLIDEILSVGDASFQKKCFEKIEEFKKQNKTLIITAQSLDVIERLCDEVFLLEDGRLEKCGDPLEVVNCYRKLLNEKRLLKGPAIIEEQIKWWANKEEWDRIEGAREAEVTSVKILNGWGRQTDKFKIGDRLIVNVDFLAHEEIKEPHFGVAIFREDGVYCYGPNTTFDGYRIEKLNKGKGWFRLEYEALLLMPGYYHLSIAIWDKKEVLAYIYHIASYRIQIVGSNGSGQLLFLPHRWKPAVGWKNFMDVRFTKPLNLAFLEDKRMEELHSEKVEVISVELLNEDGNLKDFFRTGEKVEVKVRLKINELQSDYYLWVGIFRKDNIYCHGALRRLTENEEEISLIYSKLHLLRGEYQISVGVWGLNTDEPVICRHRVCSFTVLFDRGDHGTVYLDHKWKWKLP